MKSAPQAHGTPGRRPRTLGRRELNRALLSRQLLLDPAAGLEPLDAIGHLVGLQAQATLPPYLGLRARLAKFEAPMLATLLSDRRAVRLTLLRGTVHLVSAADARRLRPLLQPVIERGFNGTFGRRMRQVDLATLRAAVVELLAAKPLSGRELGRRLAAAGLESDEQALGSAARVHVPLVQVPPRGILGAGGQARYQTLASWLDPPSGQAPVPAALLDELVMRYLAAFGPASAQDVQSWSGLTRLAEVLERLSPGLERFRDEQGRVLFDLPDAPRPDPDTPAPVRFLGEFDNLFLAHVDRSRSAPRPRCSFRGARRAGRLTICSSTG